MDVLIAGGGTGGHLFPGIALAQELRRRDATARIVFVGTARGIEVRAVPKAGFELKLLAVSGLRRVGAIGFVRGLLRLPLSLLQAFAMVRRFRPDVAVSVGGYAAGPAVLASRLLGVRCVVMEQNAIVGFTNRILGKLAHRFFAALPLTGASDSLRTGVAASKVQVLGNPVRQDLLAVRDDEYEPALPLQVLILGGSQGSRALNETVMATLPALAKSSTCERGLQLRIRHQTGYVDLDRVAAAYGDAGLADCEVLPFIDDMATAYRDAHLVICRSGATTIAELTVCGRPAVLVPYPYAVDDHQAKNAMALHDGGAAILVAETELTPERLLGLLTELAGDLPRLRTLAEHARAMGHPNAARAIADELDRLLSAADRRVTTGGADV